MKISEQGIRAELLNHLILKVIRKFSRKNEKEHVKEKVYFSLKRSNSLSGVYRKNFIR